MVRRYAGCSAQDGFTLVELIIAMAIFSMSLMIIVTGFINILHLRDQAIAMNTVQDNARTAMDQIVQAIRDSSGMSMPVVAGSGPTGTTLCLPSSTGPSQFFRVTDNVLERADGCPPETPANVRAVTAASGVRVANFEPEIVAEPTLSGAKPVVQVTLTLASSSALTGPSGVQCGSTVEQRSFCSVVTLVSGGTPR